MGVLQQLSPYSSGASFQKWGSAIFALQKCSVVLSSERGVSMSN